VDGLVAAGPVAGMLAGAATNYHSRLGNLVFHLGHRVVAEWPWTQRATGRMLMLLARRGLLRAVADAGPDVVVSTYPATTEVLARLRLQGRLGVPLVSAITDLASLRYWAHAGVDLHLVTHPESAEEVRSVAGAQAAVTAVRGLTSEAFRHPAPPAEARARLGLPAGSSLVVVSGGGWAVGDLDGAIDEALAAGAGTVVALCGRRDDVRDRITARHAAGGSVQAWPFTDEMPDLLAAADVLVHSTAGLTVLEAMMSGCRTISFGWGLGHIRANNRAYERFGLADIALSREKLAVALRRALQAPRPQPWQPELPLAADLVLAQAGTASG
jgi:UDP-N-acetylglucosamine:LPS N-acetylglucosamine transferase